MSDNSIVWNVMKPCHFEKLLDKKRLTLKRFAEYTAKDELHSISDIARDQIKPSQLAPGVDMQTAVDELSKIFLEQRQCTYIQCFYDGEAVTAGHIDKFGGVAVRFDKKKLIQRCNEEKARDMRHPFVVTNNVRYTNDLSADSVTSPEDWSRFLLLDLGCVFLKNKDDYIDEKEFRIAKNYRAFCIGEGGKFKSEKLIELGHIQRELYYTDTDMGDHFESDVCKFEHIAIEPCDIEGIALGGTVDIYKKKSELSCLLQEYGLQVSDNMAWASSSVRRYKVSNIVTN